MNRNVPLLSSLLLLLILVAAAFARTQTAEAIQLLPYDTAIERELSGGQKHLYQVQLEDLRPDSICTYSSIRKTARWP
jgi:hypothetical protein